VEFGATHRTASGGRELARARSSETDEIREVPEEGARRGETARLRPFEDEDPSGVEVYFHTIVRAAHA
jgi:hypothetical protein